MTFDEAAAAAAIEACRAAAAAVDGAADDRRAAATDAKVEWRGPARDDFDVEVATLEREAAALVTDLRLTAGAIQRAWDAARLEWARSQAAG